MNLQRTNLPSLPLCCFESGEERRGEEEEEEEEGKRGGGEEGMGVGSWIIMCKTL
jgi:hypothetical protein